MSNPYDDYQESMRKAFNEPVCTNGCDWCGLEAAHESLREHMGRIKVLESALSVVLEGFTLPDDVRKILETAYWEGKE